MSSSSLSSSNITRQPLDSGLFQAINLIIESAGPSFITGSARFNHPQTNVSDLPSLSQQQICSLAALTATRQDRSACICYIYSRLDASCLFLLHCSFNRRDIHDYEEKTKAVIAVLLCWIAFYIQCEFFGDLIENTSDQNLHLVQQISQSPPDGSFNFNLVSLNTIAGHLINFSSLPLFRSSL